MFITTAYGDSAVEKRRGRGLRTDVGKLLKNRSLIALLRVFSKSAAGERSELVAVSIIWVISLQ